jgi:hypothetical protein
VALQGTIETFALPDVLRLLASSKKTGRLRVSGSRGSGSVWVESGAIVQTDATGAPHALSNIDVVFELLRYRDGSFTFENDRHAPDPGGSQDVEPVLVEAELQLAEWREIESVIPSIECHVRLNPDLPRADVVIDADQWRVLVAIGGGTSVSQVGDTLILGELAVSRVLRDLVELGVVDVLEPGTEPEAEPEAEPEPERAVAKFEKRVERAEKRTRAIVDEQPDPEEEVLLEPAPEPVAGPVAEPEPEAADAQYDDDEDDDEPVGRSARAELDALTSGFGFEDGESTSNAVEGAPLREESTAGGSYDFASGEFGSDGPSPDNGNGHGAAASTQDRDALGPAPFGGADPLFAPSGGTDPLFADPGQGADPLFADSSRPSGPPPPPPPPPGFDPRGDDSAGEVARQLANLSPKAARAVAAAARAGTDEEREAHLAEAEDGEGINRNLLLNFLSSTQD